MHPVTLIIVSLCFTFVLSMPMMPYRVIPIYNPAQFQNLQQFQTRGPLDFIGEWIQGSDWFPIEINVPDTITGIGQGIQQGWTNFQSGLSNFAQNIPFLNRIQTQLQNFQTQPRPYKIIVLMPTDPKRMSYNPFENELNQFPVYP